MGHFLWLYFKSFETGFAGSLSFSNLLGVRNLNLMFHSRKLKLNLVSEKNQQNQMSSEMIWNLFQCFRATLASSGS